MRSFSRALWFSALLSAGCDPHAINARPVFPKDAGTTSDAAPAAAPDASRVIEPAADAARASTTDVVDAHAPAGNGARAASDPKTGDQDAGDRDASDRAADAGDAGAVDRCIRPDHQLSVSAPPVELARLATSPVFDSRSLGPTMRLGSSDHVWTFSATKRVDAVAAENGAPANHPFVAFDGTYQPWKAPPSKSAAWRLREADAGTPLPPTVLPLKEGEGNQVSFIPTSLVRLPDQPRGLMFVTQFDLLTPTKVWLATLEDGQTRATRSALPLFSEPPLFGLGARVDGELATMYACSPASETAPSRCVVAQVPVAMIDQPSAYRVWATNAAGVDGWSSDLKSGKTVLENVNGELSVTYNSYLQRLVVVYGEPFANHVVLRTSKLPYGPWSEPVRVALPAPSALNNVSIREHPSLAQDCERRLVISYLAPTRADGVFAIAGDLVLAAIDLD